MNYSFICPSHGNQSKTIPYTIYCFVYLSSNGASTTSFERLCPRNRPHPQEIFLSLLKVLFTHKCTLTSNYNPLEHPKQLLSLLGLLHLSNICRWLCLTVVAEIIHICVMLTVVPILQWTLHG